MQIFKTKVKSLYLAQPDASTCQSACIAMVTSNPDIAGIRAKLVSQGVAGDPYNMGRLLKAALGNRYNFEDDASLKEIREWLKNGEILITHGYFSASGHVIVLDGVAIDPDKLSYKLDVRDPYGEFDAKSWSYKGAATKYDGYYSSHLIYATCVAGQSVTDARRIYQRGELDSTRPGAWIHRVRP